MCTPQVTVCWIHLRRASLYQPNCLALHLDKTGSASRLSGRNTPTAPTPLKIKPVNSCGVERKERCCAPPGMEASPGRMELLAERRGDAGRVRVC